MNPIEVIINKLEEAGCGPAQTSSGWQSRCPAHDDRKASLSIAEGEDGRVLVKCFAGCATADVVGRLGLQMSDIAPKKMIEAIYPYHGENGDVLYEKIRYKGKKFTQRRPDGEGGYVWGLKACWHKKGGDGWHPVKQGRDQKKQPSSDTRWFPDTVHVLYRRKQVEEAVAHGETVLFVEGEKDADNAEMIGIQATTSGGASEPWSDEFGEPLRGARLVFIPDSDDAGRKLFEKYAPHLSHFVDELRCLILPEGCKDLTEYLEAGHTRADLDKLLAAAPIWRSGVTAEILDESPDIIRRPLCLIGGHAYASTWVTVRQGAKDETALIVIRDDGQIFTDKPVPGAKPLGELGIKVDLPNIPDPGQIMSGASVKRYANGERTNPPEVFERVRKVIDWSMDFGHSIGTQSDLVDLAALYVFVSYGLDAFNVVGFLWPNGDKGVGKTKLLLVITGLGYLGMLVLAGGTYASLRDLADYGGCIGFDDAEGVMDIRRSDPDKRALLLAGNRRGCYITVKEPCGDGWKSRRIHAFCPRLFSAINQPDEVLESRTITIPQVRSADGSKANNDPMDYDSWPVNRRRLVDDLWAVGLAGLHELKTYDKLVVDRVELVGRVLEPWRAILATALWLQERYGVFGLFDRLSALATHYQVERHEILNPSPVHVAIIAMQGMLASSSQTEFTPTELATVMNSVAQADEIDHAGDAYTNARKVGALLRRLRLERAQRTSGGKRWRVSADDLGVLARAYGIAKPFATPEAATGQQCRDAVIADRAVLREPPPAANHNCTAQQTETAECRCDVSAEHVVLRETPPPQRQTANPVNGLQWED